MRWILLAVFLSTPPEDAVLPPDARLSALLPDLSSSDASQVGRAWESLEKLCFNAGRPGAESERKQVAAAILARLDSEASVGARVILLRALETLGKAEAIPTLAKLIAPGNDPAIREGARRALEANPHVNAKKELRAALQRAEGPLRAGILHSLGARRDFLATADLISATEEKDSTIKLAALEALAEIGDISAVPVLEQALVELHGLDVARAQRAYLRLADSLVRNNERGAARRIYDKAAGISPAFKAAALMGFARAGLQSEVDRIVQSLDDPDRAVRGAAQEAAASIPGDNMTKALLQKMSSGSRLPALQILARRGGAEARAAILRSSVDATDPVEKALVIRLLATLPPEKDSGTIAEALLKIVGSEGEPGAAAEQVVSLLPGSLGEVIAAQLQAATGDRKAALLRILGARREAGPVKTIEAAVADSSATVRVAALKALGDVGEASSARTLLSSLGSAAPLEAQVAVAALARLKGGEAARAISDALSSSKGSQRASILRVLGLRADPGSLEILKDASADSDPAVRQAAIEGLARANDPSVLPILLAAAEKGSGETQTLAVRGALRFAEQLAKGDPGKATAIYVKALEISRSENELRIALRGAAEVGGADVLERVLPYLKPGPLQRDAGRAALRVAERLPEDKQAGAREVYERVLELDPDNATANQCVRRLRRLGVTVDYARKGGFVTRWWILAPLPNPQGALWEKSLPPESAVDLSAKLDYEGQNYEWKAFHTPSPRGLIDLDEAGYGSPAAGAYLYAEISVKESCDALFKLGSDDQIACWLNGVKVHANRASRGLEVDQDSVQVHLNAGANRVLLKVLNDGGGWGACLRVTSRDGKPLELVQKES